MQNTRLKGVVRPYTFTVQDTLDADVQAACEGKAGRMFAGAIAYTVQVATWRTPAGKLWAPNTTVTLYAPGEMIYTEYEFLIRSVAFSRPSDEGSVASLTLTVPEAFAGNNTGGTTVGLITVILSAERGTQNTAKVTDIKHNPGGGANQTSELFQPPGVDSVPLPGDYAATTEVQRTGGEAVVGTLDPKAEQTAAAGEARLYARSADGTEVASVHAKNDGTITSSNDNSSIEQSPDGTVVAVNTGGAGHTLNPDGSVVVTTPHGDKHVRR